MKKITLVLLLLNSFTILFGQAPQKMNYQSVIRKTDGTLLTNTLVGIKTSILLGSATGTTSYVETQTTTTNANGLATIEIGGGTPVTGTFSGIDWGAGSHFVKTEIDPAGGTNYTISGTSQLLSVPYALYAGSSVNKGKTSIVLSGNITDAQALAQVQAEYGPNTENVYVVNTTNLVSLDLSVIKNLINLNVVNNSKLTTINLNNLTEIFDVLYISQNEKLSAVSLPVLRGVNGSNNYIANNKSLTSISLPSFTYAVTFFYGYNPLLTSIDIPSFSLLMDNGSGISFPFNALPSSQINLILNRLLNLQNAKPYVNLNNQTPPAPPTGQGLIDKATLVSRGISVATD